MPTLELSPEQVVASFRDIGLGFGISECRWCRSLVAAESKEAHLMANRQCFDRATCRHEIERQAAEMGLAVNWDEGGSLHPLGSAVAEMGL